MKLFTVLFSTLLLSTAMAASDVAFTVELPVRAVVLKVQAACVARVNFEGEGDYSLYFDSQSYKAVAALEKKGLTTKYIKGGITCQENWLLKHGEANVDFLNYADVNLYDKAEVVEGKVKVMGGFKEISVVFYNWDELEENFKKSTNDGLEGLLQ